MIKMKKAREGAPVRIADINKIIFNSDTIRFGQIGAINAAAPVFYGQYKFSRESKRLYLRPTQHITPKSYDRKTGLFIASACARRNRTMEVWTQDEHITLLRAERQAEHARVYIS